MRKDKQDKENTVRKMLEKWEGRIKKGRKVGSKQKKKYRRYTVKEQT